ncbi:sulfatase [Paenibacillus sp. JSM ZJ436]|uniref:sulfatase n=1 Tax=Paenibacillus sp. JSM ZJ436 TaxID=3376190 RepID=UPI00378EC21F
MKAVMLMFDTLNRRMLSPYGCDWTHTPNFRRLAERTAVFDQAYVGSMPCMPARRELHTGRHNFLHRSWGPIEPFDDSMPELLKRHGVYSHLVTDHQHYWEDGGATYHTRYSSFELIRGQEGDPWKGHVKDPVPPETVTTRPLQGMFRQDWINRQYCRQEEDFPQAKTFAAGLEFIRRNHGEDRWFLQLETFDPHEPFHAPEKYRELYPHTYEGKHFDWPMYRRVTETQEEIDHVRLEYAALLSMCDAYLGKVLDVMDELGMWEDTMLIVNTDHGFLLGEHDWWAKSNMPFYNEIAHMPLFIWDPRTQASGVRRSSLVQNVDLAPTLLRYFGIEVPPDMTGHCLQQTIAQDVPVREAAIFGIHGGHVNCTDGRYVYMRGPASSDNRPLYNYTLMPTRMRSRFEVAELRSSQLHEPFAFTKGVPVLQIPVAHGKPIDDLRTMLFDVEQDPQQLEPITDPDAEERMLKLLQEVMAREEAPAEQYIRLGLEQHAAVPLARNESE